MKASNASTDLISFFNKLFKAFMKKTICSDASGISDLLFFIRHFLCKGDKFSKSLKLYSPIRVILYPIFIFLYRNNIPDKKFQNISVS